jgi:Zn-dependent protease
MSDATVPRAPPRAHAFAFSLFGFRVRVQAAFLFLAAFLAFAYRSGDAASVAEWVGVVFVSVLFHELGHAIVARRAGYQPWIELHGMGGLTHLDRTEATPPPTWTSDLAIALAGPFFGFALGGAVWSAAHAFPGFTERDAVRAIVRDLLWANVGWSVLNLLPMLPWDGGLAARAVLRRVFPRQGDRMAYRLSVIVASAGLAVALYSRNLWIGYLAGRALIDSLRVLRRYRFEASLGRAWDLWDRGAIDAARSAAEALSARAPDPLSRARAVELVVFACLGLKDSAGAKAAYDAYPAGIAKSVLLAGIVELDCGDRAKAGEHLRNVAPGLLLRVLFPLVMTWARSGWEDRAKDWLDEATCAALPKEVTLELESRLSQGGQRSLSAHLHEMQGVNAARSLSRPSCSS